MAGIPDAVFAALVALLMGLAAYAYARHGHAANGRLRQGWYFLSAAALLGLLSLLLQPVAYSSRLAAVLAGAAAALAAIAGGALLVMGLHRGARALRDVADGLVISISFFFLAWPLAVHKFAPESRFADGRALAVTAYPVISMGLGLALMLMAHRSGIGARIAVVLLGASLAASGATIGLLSVLDAAGVDTTGPGWLFVWIVSMAIGASVILVPRGRPAIEPTSLVASVRSAWFAAGAVAAGLVVSAVHVMDHGHLDSLLYWFAASSFAIVVGRQVMSTVEIDRAGRRLLLANQALEKGSRDRQAFLRLLAHDVVGAMTPIKLQAHILQKGLHSQQDPSRQSVEILSRSAGHLERLLLDLRDFARMADGRLEVRKADADVAAIVRNVLDGFRPQAESLGIRLELAGIATLPAMVDADRLQQAVTNLVRNAIKFTPKGGRIEVRVGAQAGAAHIQVADDGRGMAPDEIPRLFQPFAQTHQKGEGREVGTGLGLYIVRGIVEAHGGTVSAHSDGLGKGSTFTIRVPTGTPMPGRRGLAPSALVGASAG